MADLHRRFLRPYLIAGSMTDTIDFLSMRIFQTKRRIDKVLDDADLQIENIAKLKKMEKDISATSVEHVMWERDLLKMKNRVNIDLRILDTLIVIKQEYEDLFEREKALEDWKKEMEKES